MFTSLRFSQFFYLTSPRTRLPVNTKVYLWRSLQKASNGYNALGGDRTRQAHQSESSKVKFQGNVHSLTASHGRKLCVYISFLYITKLHINWFCCQCTDAPSCAPLSTLCHWRWLGPPVLFGWSSVLRNTSGGFGVCWGCYVGKVSSASSYIWNILVYLRHRGDVIDGQSHLWCQDENNKRVSQLLDRSRLGKARMAGNFQWSVGDAVVAVYTVSWAWGWRHARLVKSQFTR